MTGFENKEVLQNGLCNDCGCIGFAPKISYVVDATAKTVKVTDATTYGSGDGLASVIVHVYDRNGKEKQAKIDTDGTEVTINVSTLDLSSIDITATIVSDKGCKADLSAYKIGSVALSGSLANINNQ
ncbi:hypothetical protein [Chryseobacterium gambrini]|uniref:hypothetical protein n=1 Tax=Chryseobacterium gambrini TaxID=373672 RepID=UPI003D0E7C3A